MKEVRIYLYCTLKGARVGNGAYSYLLETQMGEEVKEILETDKVMDMTANKAILYTLKAALKRMRCACSLIIYTDSPYLATNARDCLKKWRNNGWKTARGKPVEHQKEWQEIQSMLEPHKVSYVVSSDHDNYQRMKIKAEEVAKCI